MVTLSIRDVTVSYGRRVVLPSLTLNLLQGGTLVGLLGPNASGKSTLIKSIAQILPRDNGEIELRDGDRAPYQGKEFRNACGYVPQELPDAASLTAFETVLVSARRLCAGDPVKETAALLAKLGLGEIAQRHLNELSGGQRQMIAAAQMLVGTPQLMLLDEPTSALDLHRQLFLLDLVKQRVIDDGVLGIVALHDINLAARFCDELVVLREGTKVAQGSPAKVLTSELIRDVYHVEAELLDHSGSPIVVPQTATT